MSQFSHLNQGGEVHMVDVSGKGSNLRIARARGFIGMAPETLAAITNDRIAKGSVLVTARLAGIMAAKKTSELIPLCHGLALDHVEVTFAAMSDGIAVQATTTCNGKTGVEMEALVAASTACLTIYDMAKALDKAMVVSDLHLVSKEGGKSGEWRNTAPPLREWPLEWS